MVDLCFLAPSKGMDMVLKGSQIIGVPPFCLCKLYKHRERHVYSPYHRRCSLVPSSPIKISRVLDPQANLGSAFDYFPSLCSFVSSPALRGGIVPYWSRAARDHFNCTLSVRTKYTPIHSTEKNIESICSMYIEKRTRCLLRPYYYFDSVQGTPIVTFP